MHLLYVKYAMHVLRMYLCFILVVLYPALSAKIADWKEVPLSRFHISPHYKIWYSSLYTGLDPFYPAVSAWFGGIVPFICMHTYTYIRMYVCMFLCICLCTYVCTMYVRMYVCKFVCTYVSIY